ncbi:MAG: hypothetical protein ACREE3_01270 [Stellaceae bacterium]
MIGAIRTVLPIMTINNDKRGMAKMGITGCEPALEEMLSDPMTKALMASDGVDAEEVKNLLVKARDRRSGSTSNKSK